LIQQLSYGIATAVPADGRFARDIAITQRDGVTGGIVHMATNNEPFRLPLPPPFF
jgi:hypothetical protein